MHSSSIIRTSISTPRHVSLLVQDAVVYSTKAKGSRRVAVEDANGLAKTKNQVLYSKHLSDPGVGMVVGIGPAGSGKTLLSCAHAIQGLVRNDIKKIVITRPTVSADEQIGFLPGSLEEKMLPWMVPIYDCFKEYVSAQRLREYMHNEEIEVCPLSFMRGRTFHNSWVIADEVQNSTVNQMRTLLTRVGQNSKIVLTGDLAQCDSHAQNGLADFLKRYGLWSEDAQAHHTGLEGYEEPTLPRIEVVRFEDEDVLRSDLVKVILDVYRY